jgi:hypothetical protein
MMIPSYCIWDRTLVQEHIKQESWLLFLITDFPLPVTEYEVYKKILIYITLYFAILLYYIIVTDILSFWIIFCLY